MISINNLRIIKNRKRQYLLSFILIALFFLYSKNSFAQSDATINSVVKIIAYENAYLYPPAYCEKNFQTSYAIPLPNTSLGSGVLISEDGLIVTAKHVVEDSRIVLVRLPGDNDEVYPAYYVYEDEELDIAFLYLNKKVKNYLRVPREMPQFNYNSPVVAIGYPIDPTAIRPTLSKGEVTSWSKTEIQFNSRIIGGFSGGALVSEKNELMGIISRHFTGNVQSPNLSRAVILDKIYGMINEKIQNKLPELIKALKELSNKQKSMLNDFSKIFYFYILGDKENYEYTSNQINSEDFEELAKFPGIISSFLSLEIANDWLSFITYLDSRKIPFDANFSWLITIKENYGEKEYQSVATFYGEMTDKARTAYKLDNSIIEPKETVINDVNVYNLINILLEIYSELKKGK